VLYNRFIESLRNHLQKIYPVNVESRNNTGQGDDGSSDEMVHIFFPPHQVKIKNLLSFDCLKQISAAFSWILIALFYLQFYAEFLPFAITLLVLFLYVYFSCNKIELVRSKLGIALSAVFTVLGAVTMSLGLSGVSLNINSKVFFPGGIRHG